MAQEDIGIDIKDVRQNPDKYLELSLLVCGQTGIGKSTLVNSLVGESVCPVGDPGKKWSISNDVKEVFGAETKTLQKSRKEINGVPVIIWDSPGLQDGTRKDRDYLQMIHDSCKDVNLVLFCHDMTKTRWTGPDMETLHLLTKTFGLDFWKRCVLVFTKANALCPDLDDGETEYDYQKHLYDNFVELFRSELKGQGVPSDIADCIPGIAVGRIGRNPKDRYLWYVSDKVRETGEQQDFLPEFWVTCFERLYGDGRQKLLDVFGINRIVPIDASAEEAQRYFQNLEERERFHQWIIKSLERKVAGPFETLMRPVHSVLSHYVGGTTYEPSSTSAQAQCSSTTQAENTSALGQVHPAAVVPKERDTGATPTAMDKTKGKKSQAHSLQIVPKQHDTGATSTATRKMQGKTKVISLEVNNEHLKRINNTLESDQKERVGLLYRIARWIKSLLSPLFPISS